MNMSRKPLIHRGPQLARSANATGCGMRVRGRRPGRSRLSPISTSSPSPTDESTFSGSRIAQTVATTNSRNA